MSLPKKMKIIIICVSIVVTGILLMMGIAPWVSEPRDYIKNDPGLMRFHPFTSSMFSLIFFVLWVVAMKFSMKFYVFFNEIDKALQSKNKEKKI